MERPVSKNSDKSSKDYEMVTVEASALVREVAGPRLLGDNTKTLLARAARRLGFTYSRTRSIYYGDARVIRAEEWIRLNEELAALSKSAQQRQDVINDISILARAVPPPAREAARPLGVDGDAGGEAGPWGKRRAG